ncbi:MAG: hypothetical protein HQM03_08260 [Magnetococcales bacterium]|nr:hypothetical protein [Magnetococcales bacterium]
MPSKTWYWPLAILLLPCLNALAETKPETLLPYTNLRFGFAISRPAFLTTARESDNGDGATFASRDGETIMIAYASLNFDNNDIIFHYSKTLERFRQDSVNVTYQTVKKNGYVVSGTKGNRIVYEKAIGNQNNAIIATYSLEYPAARKEPFDAILPAINQSFRFVAVEYR